MGTNRSRDEWADARLGETMHRVLGSMAAQAGRVSELDAAMSTVRSRIRRRRAAKQVGIGATTLVTVAALAVGGAALLPEQAPQPGPATTPSPSVASELCGQQIDLEPSIDPFRFVRLTGPERVEAVAQWPASIEVWTNADGERIDFVAEVVELREVEIVATVDGAIVGVAAEPRWGGRLQVNGDNALTSDATLVGCADGAPLDPGSYELYAQGVLRGDQRFVTNPARVEVLPEGETTPSEPASEPSDPTSEPPRGECSAAQVPGDMDPDFSGLSGPAAETATTLLGAAIACDDETLIAFAEGTNLTFGDSSAEEFWTLPGAEEHEDVYAILARLLTLVEAAELPASGEAPAMYVWPRLQAGEDSDAAWQEVVDAGIVTQEQADQMRAGGGYMGWRLGITEDGTWQFFVGGD